MLIAKYMFDSTINADVLPTFNSRYEYTVEDMNYSETFDTYNNVLPSYYGYNAQYHSPIILSDGTLRYIDSGWDWYSLDVTEYVNKQVTVSFDISCVNDEQSWRYCEGWITGYDYNIGEGVTAGSEPKHISYTSTLLSNTFDIQGVSIKLTNIQIMVEGVNLFDILPGFNSYFIRDDYDPTRNDNTACKVNNELWFTYSPWAQIWYDISTLSECDITVSFDINKFDAGDDSWIQFDHGVFDTNVSEIVRYEDIVGDTYGAITDTIHVEVTFTLEPGFNGYYVLEGMNGLVSNFKIEVQSPYTTRSIYSDTSPTSITFNNDTTKTSCVSVEYLDISNIKSMRSMFQNCYKLTKVVTSNWDTSKVTDMAYMFFSCSSLTQLDVSNFNTSNVTNMYSMFNTCKLLTQLDVSNWNTSNVANMRYMFYNCSSLTQLDVSNWDTSNVTNIGSMFHGCVKLTQLDVSNWDTSNVSDMNSVFSYCSSLDRLDVSNFDTSKVTTTTDMFNSCKLLTQLDVSNFDTSKVTDMRFMFNGCNKLTSLDLSSFDTMNVTSMLNMFSGCNALTSLDVSNFDTSNVTNMAYMFQHCKALTSLDLSGFDTTNVTTMNAMFNGCNILTSLDVSNFDTFNVTDMAYMFQNCSSLDRLDVSNFDTSKVTTTTDMFNKTTNLVNIGMIYCSLNTINTLSSLLPTTNAKQVYVHDVSSSECTEVSNITFIDYISDSEIITSPRALLPGDELLWDDSSQRYIIECSDGTSIQTDMTSKFKIDLYTPYTMIYADNATSISLNIKRKEM